MSNNFTHKILLTVSNFTHKILLTVSNFTHKILLTVINLFQKWVNLLTVSKITHHEQIYFVLFFRKGREISEDQIFGVFASFHDYYQRCAGNLLKFINK